MPWYSKRASRSWARRLAWVFLALGPVFSSGGAPSALAADHAVVLMYHRFGETEFSSTNIGIEAFEAHIRELKEGGYTVWPISRIVDAVRNRRPLPERTVGLTVDDAYASVFANAWPRIKAAGLPFTLFVSTDPIDKGQAGFMTWDQIRELARNGVEIGAHTASHLHMVDGGRALGRTELARSTDRFVIEIGKKPTLFAYPYGETSSAIRRLVKEWDYGAAFGQQSGVVNPTSDFHYLPRFALNERYGRIQRFRRVLRTLPLPVTEVTPDDQLVGATNPPALGFTVARPLKGLDRLACYPSHGGGARIERLGARRIEIRLGRPFPPGRSRVNCTLPGAGGVYRWFGMLFYRPGN
jgi:peptidoglycan/xylan/chitin deacetylase (PgdA/CDA1 family)